MAQGAVVSIDSRPVGVEKVLCLYQADPHPGGHQFRIETDGSDVSRWLAELDVGVIDAQRSRRYLEIVERIVDLTEPTQQAGKADWFLNTVDCVIIGCDSIIFEGRCSPRLERNERS